jgi:hypothetical protein
MATRRNFFKYLGLAGGVAGGGIVAAAAVLPDPNKAECINQIQQSSGFGLNLTHTYGVEESKPSVASHYNTISVAQKNYVPGTEKTVNLGLNVGPDGEMYLKINDKWRRVVTE